MRVHALVSGLVQGVGFRYFTARRAQRLDLAGFVQNLPDGRVEVMAEGDPGALEALVAALREGPRGAVVRDVCIEWTDAPVRVAPERSSSPYRAGAAADVPRGSRADETAWRGREFVIR